jgi:hypothetical protein
MTSTERAQLTIIAVLMLAIALMLTIRPASAQQFLGGNVGIGRFHGYSGGPSFTSSLTAKDLACYRANYASTLAMQRCADVAISGLMARDKRSRRK